MANASVVGNLVDALDSRLATVLEPVLGDEPLSQLDRVRLDVDADARQGGEPLRQLDDRPTAAATDIEQPAAAGQLPGQSGQ